MTRRNAFQRETDRLAAVGAPARFRRVRSLDGGDGERIVSLAISRAKEGDSEALRFLYARYAHNVYGYVCSIVRDEHDAEDITQQVFLKLMSVISKYEPRGVPFSAWILRVARNVAVDHMRQRRPVPVEELFAGDAEAGEAPYEQRATISEALGMLPDEQRQVVVLRHLVGLSPGEIAEHLGKSECAVHGLHHRGRGVVKTRLAQLGSAPATTAQSSRAHRREPSSPPRVAAG
jgi:RNA polymerase sigma-70 factor (ECF subfamily)